MAARQEVGTKVSALGEREKWSGECRAAHSESLPKRNAAAEPRTQTAAQGRRISTAPKTFWVLR